MSGDNQWRNLALKFDEHRMQALGHLRTLLEHPQTHADAVREFLKAPPLSGEKVLAERIQAMAGNQPKLAVWYGSMPESNGKSNWTALLHRADESPFRGQTMTIDRSEYPDRVRYAADEVRYLIGEISEEPDILAYDANKYTGPPRPQMSAENLQKLWDMAGELLKPGEAQHIKYAHLLDAYLDGEITL